MSLGPVMVDLEGPSLTDREIKMLRHPQTGAVILFTRNFAAVEQLRELIAEIHSLRTPRLLVGVDHEGGRVQRFRDGFTVLPPARVLGQIYDRDSGRARELAHTIGWVMGVELRHVGVDFTFAPVLDLFHGVSHVIGDRAFHRSPEIVADLGHHVMKGLREAGMEAVGKHFPGHGAVKEDSHLVLPIDERPINEILVEDVLPFERMIHFGLAAIMPAHVVYSQADSVPAGYSEYWLKAVLRDRLGFEGVIFSDDLSMGAAASAGDYVVRAETALRAGCDMVLVCNHPDGAEEVLHALKGYENTTSQVRLARMHGRNSVDFDSLHASDDWRKAVETVAALDTSPWIEMNV